MGHVMVARVGARLAVPGGAVLAAPGDGADARAMREAERAIGIDRRNRERATMRGALRTLADGAIEQTPIDHEFQGAPGTKPCEDASRDPVRFRVATNIR